MCSQQTDEHLTWSICDSVQFCFYYKTFVAMSCSTKVPRGTKPVISTAIHWHVFPPWLQWPSRYFNVCVQNLELTFCVQSKFFDFLQLGFLLCSYTVLSSADWFCHPLWRNRREHIKLFTQYLTSLLIKLFFSGYYLIPLTSPWGQMIDTQDVNHFYK